MKKAIILATIAAAAISTLTAQNNPKKSDAQKSAELIERAMEEGEPTVLPDEADPDESRLSADIEAAEENNDSNISNNCDSLLGAWLKSNTLLMRDNLFGQMTDVDSEAAAASNTPDSVYIERLAQLGSAIPLVYNEVVRRHIIAYTTTKRQTMGLIMGRSLYYFPMIEAELDAAGLPLELRMLPVVESSLTPKARSKAGAQGLWQFMYGTGKLCGLEITSFIDQRNDPRASTRAACRFLRSLYNIYGDWNLALAAYNCGPGNVNKAIRRADGKRDFWEIYPFLPRETRNYVPAFIAANYAYAYHSLHDIVPKEAPLPLVTDTIRIDRLMHFDQISSTISCPTEVIRALNPQFKLDIVPAVKGRSYPLVLPQEVVGNFIDAESEIMAKDSTFMSEYLVKSNSGTKKFVIDSKTHVVRKGENMTAIARKYGVSVKQIVKWNNIKDPSKLRVGQKLEIFL